jgi:hypothetical protein
MQAAGLAVDFAWQENPGSNAVFAFVNLAGDLCDLARDLGDNPEGTGRACFAERILQLLGTGKEYPPRLAHFPPLVAQLVALDDPDKGLSSRQCMWLTAPDRMIRSRASSGRITVRWCCTRIRI